MTKTRKLRFGTKVPELENAIVLEVKTKCPNKWKLIDMETGEEYIGANPNENNMHWKKING